MRFRPANISLINRRHYLPRLPLTLSSIETNGQRTLTGHYISGKGMRSYDLNKHLNQLSSHSARDRPVLPKFRSAQVVVLCEARLNLAANFIAILRGRLLPAWLGWLAWMIAMVNLAFVPAMFFGSTRLSSTARSGGARRQRLQASSFAGYS
jgi:hypothetical protein